MSRAGVGRAGCSRRSGCRRRPPTWEVSDSDAEGPAGAEACARGPGPAEERRAAAKALRPEQALRRVAVRVDPAVLEDAGASILLEALSTLGCEHHVEPQCQARSLRWTRAKPDPCPRSVPCEVWAADEQDLLLLLGPEEFLQGIAQLTQTCGPACSVPWISPDSPARPHVAVIGLDAHLWYRLLINALREAEPKEGGNDRVSGAGGWSPPLRSRRPSSTQETRQPETSEVARVRAALSWPRVEEALVHLQLWAHLDVLLVASWQELSQHVCAFTKAFAQRPFKQYQESRAFPFCAAGRWAGGERVARDGSGLRGVWWRQIRQFNRVSPAVADAVVTAFPSPRLLQQAYVTCSTEEERMALLADLPVKTGDGARPRRVGPDLARRICLFLTTASPELLLDLGS